MTTALHSVVVDDTQPAAEATDPGPTEHIHAWSEKDDATEVVTYVPRHSWKLPLLCAALATSAVVGGAIFAWPHHHVPTPVPTTTHQAPSPKAQPPTPSVAPVPKPQSQDERFISLMSERGWHTMIPSMALNAAHTVCTREAQGFTDPEIAQGLVNSTPGMDMQAAAVFTDTAVEVFCPPPGVR